MGEPPPRGDSEGQSEEHKGGVFGAAEDSPQRFAKSTSPEEDREDPAVKEKKLAEARRRTKAAFDRIAAAKAEAAAKDGHSADWHSAASAEAVPTPATPGSATELPPPAAGPTVKIEVSEQAVPKAGTPESTVSTRKKGKKKSGGSSRSSRRSARRPKRRMGTQPGSSSKGITGPLESVPEGPAPTETRAPRSARPKKSKRRRQESSRKHKGKGRKATRGRAHRTRSTSSSEASDTSSTSYYDEED
jgi:hypothetical protein